MENDLSNFLESLKNHESEDFILYRRFKSAFQPGSKLGEDEIFPGIKRKPYTIMKVDNSLADEKEIAEFEAGLTKSLDVIRARSFMCKLSDQDIGKIHKFGMDDLKHMWKELNLDLDLMEILTRHLKFNNMSKHLPLNDLSLDVFMKLSNIWHNSSKDFIKGVVTSLQHIGIYEGLRRLHTMIMQISEHTIVENWKLIRNKLIETHKMSQKDAEKFEKYYKLSTRFPKLLCQIKPTCRPNFEPHLQVIILNSLGIFHSKRQDSIFIEEFAARKYSSPLWRARDDLYLRSIQNGLDLQTVISIAKYLESTPEKSLIFEPGIITPYTGKFKESGLVLWFNSPERKWLIKLYQREIMLFQSSFTNSWFII